MQMFLMIEDKDRFKHAKKSTEAGKNQDKNLKEEIFQQIKVNPESKISEDLTSIMADIKQNTEVRKQSYLHTTNQLSEFVKNSAAWSENQNIVLGHLARRMNEFSTEQNRIGIMGSASLAQAASKTVDDLGQLIKINDDKRSNSSVFNNKQITYSECTGNWSDEGGYMMDEMIKRYTVINNKKTEHKLSREQFSNAKERTKNLIAIHEAEHHHQLKMNNQVIKNSMKEYLRLHTRYLEEELNIYKKMLTNFENIEIPE